MKKNERTEKDYIEAAKNSFSIAGMCRELNLGLFGANYRRIKKAIKEYNIDTSHFTGKAWNVGSIFKPNGGVKKDLSEILVKDSEYDCTNKLKKRLINEGLKEYKCEICGRTEWNGKPIPLQLHHINGERSDNRLENLQILCPNCHALTDNYCGKNIENAKKELTAEEKYEKAVKTYGKELADKMLEKYNKKKHICENQTREPKYCPICGKEVANKRTIYCSYECAYKAQKKLPSDDVLLQYINEGKNNSEIARLCHVTEASIRKWKRNHI